ncbi:MAG TPA: DUF1553 domain-containing protein [Opitutaceae bacterium]|nr:DUF1553 domain-containing protein [Opitutaceae bacterium]
MLPHRSGLPSSSWLGHTSTSVLALAALATFTAPAPTSHAAPPSAGVARPPPAAANPFERDEPAAPTCRIDELVFAHLASLGIEPAHVCSDAVFVRRAYLDVIGTLPTAAAARGFLADRRPDKRAILIDQLLARDEFADYWTMKWCDLLRVKAEFPVNLWPNAAQEYHRWIYTAIRDNLPYDQFVRTLLTANGSNFRVGPVNFYRAIQGRSPEAIARAVALTFLGARAEKWPAPELAGLSGFFSAVAYKPTQEWKEEIVYFDPAKVGANTDAVFPAWPAPSSSRPADAVRLSPDHDPRAVFADWLIRPDNPWFTRAIVNRVWSWLLGRGIIEPADDIRPDNPATNPELLAYLQQEFVAQHYDVKRLFRLMLNSQTYQLSSIARSPRPEAEANFAFYAPRRLPAEVLIDALDQITGTTEEYSSAIPEPFTFIPESQRSIALPDGSITSTFLEMFGRPARDTGEERERNNAISATQELHLLNSTHIQRKIQQGPKLQALLRARRPAAEKITELYLTILSRPPTANERAAIAEYVKTSKGWIAGADVAWALINSSEFLYRH